MTRARDIANFGDGIATADIGDGQVTAGKLFSGFANGITQADIFRLTTDKSLTIDANEVISSNLERADDATSGLIGSGMSESSGIFTFPETGIYLVRFISVLFKDSDGVTQFRNKIEASSDSGSNFDLVAQAITGVTDNSTTNDNFGQAVCEALIDVTNASTFRVRFVTFTPNPSVGLLGETAANNTSFTFIRLGDT